MYVDIYSTQHVYHEGTVSIISSFAILLLNFFIMKIRHIIQSSRNTCLMKFSLHLRISSLSCPRNVFEVVRALGEQIRYMYVLGAGSEVKSVYCLPDKNTHNA